MFGKELISALQAEYFVAYLLHLRVLPKTFYVAKSRPGQDIVGLNGKLDSFSLEFRLLSPFPVTYEATCVLACTPSNGI